MKNFEARKKVVGRLEGKGGRWDGVEEEEENKTPIDARVKFIEFAGTFVSVFM